MSSDWPTKTLDDVCEKITDGAHASPNSVINGKYMASVKDLTPFGVDLSSARQIDVEDFNKLVKQGCRPEVGDVLIAKDGNSALDTVCTVRKPLDAVLLSSVAILRPDTEQLDYDFLKYYFSSKSVIEYLKSNFISGAAIPRVVLRDFRKAKIKLPPLDVQKKIVAVLNSLNDKIELNIQINETLEAMAEVIFKSWFVDFEPVKAKISAIEVGEDAEGIIRAAMSTISGKTDEELDQLQAEHPEHYTQLKTTAELFPTAMQDSELGEIPEGWTWKRADETCDISIGKTPPRKESQWFSSFPDGLKWISIRDMGECGVFVHDTSETLTHDAVKKFNVKKVPDNTLILSFKLTVGRVAITSGEMLTNEAIAHFIQKLGTNIPTSFYYLYLKQFDYNSLGSTSSIATAVNSKTIKALPIINPLEDLVGRFNAIVEPLFSQIKLVEKQNRDLSQLRDTLLPKLLSGELSVDAAKLAEEDG